MKTFTKFRMATLALLFVLCVVAFSLFGALQFAQPTQAAGGTATTYDYPVPTWNNADFQGTKVVLVRPKANSNTPLTFDTAAATADETKWSEFATQLTLEQHGVGEITTTTDLIDTNKSKVGGFNTSSSTSYIVFSYSPTASWINATSTNYVTLTIPQNTTLYGVTFANALELYFYDGLWSTVEPKVAETTGVTMKLVGAYNFNNKDIASTYKTVLITLEGLSTVDTSVNVGYINDFNTKITATWGQTDVSSKIQSVAAHYPMLSNLGFSLSYLKTEEFVTGATYENPVIVNIPKEVGLYNFHFTEKITLYFYNGAWSLSLPKTEGRVNVPAIKFGGGLKDNNGPRKISATEDSTTENQLILYALDESNNYVNNDTDYVKGDFNEKVTLTYGGNTNVGEQSGIYIYVQNNDFGINIAYPNNAAFLTHTDDIPYITIPANTIHYKWIFTNQIKLYFVNGVWTNVEPITQIPVDAGGYKIERSFNNKPLGSTDKNILLFYAYATSDGSRILLESNINANTLTVFNNAITINFNGQTKTGAETGVSLETSLLASYEKGFLLSYKNDAFFLDATAKDYATLTIAKDTVLFNAKLTEEVKLYFADGEWTTQEPFVFDYDLTDLDQITVGELVENAFAKKPSFKLGEADLENEVYAGVINSTKFLNSTHYAINFKFKVTSERYSIKFVLNGQTGAVESGITIRFFNQSAEQSATGKERIQMAILEELDRGISSELYVDGVKFEKDVEYYVQLILTRDKVNDKGAYLRVSFSENEFTDQMIADKTDMKGELFIPATEGFKMSQLLGKGFYLGVSQGDVMYGSAIVTNFDINPPAISFTGKTVVDGVSLKGLIESDVLAEGFNYPVKVEDLFDGVREYTATIISGELSADGKFQNGVEYQVKFVATDLSGNQMEEVLTFKCVHDATEPVITLGENVKDDRINVGIGLTKEEVIALIGATVTDNKDQNVQIVYAFPQSAFDADGKIKAGHYNVTLTATDADGNTTDYTIRVVASATAGDDKAGCGCGSSIDGSFYFATIALVIASALIIIKRKAKTNK